MKKVLILGAGRSASSLIQYLLKAAEQYEYEITVADALLEPVKQKTQNHKNARPVALDINDSVHTKQEIERADIVYQCCPPLHIRKLQRCV